MRSRSLLLALALVLAGASTAHAQTAAAPPPTNGALYSDGQSGRYLLGGSWLFRADPTDAGLAQGWWRNSSSTTDWTTVTVPNAYNAGQFTSASMAGSV